MAGFADIKARFRGEDQDPVVEGQTFEPPVVDNKGNDVPEENPEPSLFSSVKSIHDSYVKPTGNFLLDKLMYLDRPRNAFAVGVKEAHQGGLPSEGFVKGFMGEDFASTRHLLPEQFKKDHPFISSISGFVGDVVTDPLTYIGAPFATKAIKASRKGQQALAPGLDKLVDNDLVRAFNIHKGDLKKYKILQDKYRNLASYDKHVAIKKAKLWDDEIRKGAKEMGWDVDDLKTMIIDEVESPTGKAPAFIAAQAEKIRRLNHKQILIEKKLGIPTGELGNYFPHIPTQEAKKALNAENIKQIFRQNKATHGSTKTRNIEGTIQEINMQGRHGVEKFFIDDPVIAQTARNVRHTDATNAARFLDEAGKFLSGTGDDFIETSIPRLKGKMFNKDIARELERTHQLLINPPEMGKFLSLYDKAQNWWKMWSLGARPAYHARNVVGNIWNNYLGDVTNPAVYRDASKLQSMSRKGAFSGKIAGRPAQEIYEEAAKRGVLNKGQYGGDVVMEVMDELDNAISKTKFTDLITPSTHNKILRTGFSIGHGLEDNARLAHFIDKVKKGSSFDDAARSTKKYLFDYGDLSDIERQVFKRFIPFYTWTRKNIPLQLETMATKPHKFQKINIARNQAQDDVDIPDEQNVPEYIKDMGPIYYGNSPDGDAKAFTLMNYLPAMDVNRLTNPVDLIGGMISPLIKTPAEMMTNYDTFRRREIERFEGETVDFMGVKMPVYFAHVMKNLIMLNEFDRLNPFSVFGENYTDEKTGARMQSNSFGLRDEVGGESFAIGTPRENRTDLPFKERLVQYFTGVRPYAIDVERQKLMNNAQFRSDVRRMKTMMRGAKRKGKERQLEEIQKALSNAIDEKRLEAQR